MVLHINIFSSRLTFSVFCKNNTGFIVYVKYIGTYKVCNSQFIKRLPDSYTFMGRVFQGNILNFGSGGKDNALFFTLLED